MRFFSLLFMALSLTFAFLTAEAQVQVDHDHDHDGNSCFLIPPNKQSYPERSGNPNMSFKVFNQIIDAAESVYAPVFQEKGMTLKVHRLWSDPEPNAGATVALKNGQPYKRSRLVFMYGGLARHPDMTPDGFLLVLCHEIGHHLGGYPAYTRSDWASTEGQSDYFASLKCARRVYEKFDNVSWAKRAQIDPAVRQQCVKAHREGDREEMAICMRTAMAGQSLARVLHSLSARPGEQPKTPTPKFTTPDRTVVPVTYQKHPQAQCRLDTYLQGALCRVPATEELSDRNPREGVCVPERATGFLGARPACWFNPARHAETQPPGR